MKPMSMKLDVEVDRESLGSDPPPPPTAMFGIVGTLSPLM